MGKYIDMRLADEPFEKIWREEKTVEIRLNDEKRREINVGDKIFFHLLSKEDSIIIATVTALHRFDTFQQLFSSALFSKIGSGDMSADEAAQRMYQYYTAEQEQKYGVLGIEIKYEEDLSFVYGMLKDEYSDCDISDEDIRWFADELNDYVFVENCDLNDILAIVYNFEEAMRGKGAVIEVGRQCCIYEQIINNLELNEENAQRLYESFLFYRDCQAFSYLMNEYEEWITPEQRAEILSIARECFIEEVWERYLK